MFPFKNQNMVQGAKLSMTLANSALDTILEAENCCEAMSVLWNMEGYIPTMIEQRAKTAQTSYEKLLYSFNPHILQNIWGCPDKYLEKYSDNSDIDNLLDDIIYGDVVDIMEIPKAILQLLDKRDHQICETAYYKCFFERAESNIDLDIGWDWENHCSEEHLRIVERDEDIRIWGYSAINDPHLPFKNCGCGSEYFDGECYCRLDDYCGCGDYCECSDDSSDELF